MLTIEQKYRLQRLLAATYIHNKEGYSFKLCQQVLKRQNFSLQKINHNIMTNIMTTVIRKVYRYIEEFIIKQAKNQIEIISIKDFNILRSQLIQANEWLQDGQLKTLQNFVKIIYHLKGAVKVEVNQALGLYRRIRNMLKEHTANYGFNVNRLIKDNPKNYGKQIMIQKKKDKKCSKNVNTIIF